MKFLFSKRLHTLTPEQEEEHRRKIAREAPDTFKDRMIMVGTAFVCLFLPAVLVLLLMAFGALWLFGLL